MKFCLKPGDAGDTPATPVASTAKVAAPTGHSTAGECLLYVYCFVGLNVSYLAWGLMQEKIITQEYVSYRMVDGHAEPTAPAHFGDSQFLVFVNRALAFAVAGAWLLLLPHLTDAPPVSQRHRAPLFKYSYASLSNIMSAWFQYEALKFVSFPTQVLAKSCKILPVMMMGRIVSRTRYEFYEYLTACLISLGMVCFLLGSADGAMHRTSITTMAGVLLLTLYLVSDSFTSNWQNDLFRTYQMRPVQMMCGVSGFSALFTGASLAVQGGFAESVQFAVDHPKFVVDCVVLSASSAVGQLFIFYTISKFGAVGFTIIMTVRQVSGTRVFESSIACFTICICMIAGYRHSAVVHCVRSLHLAVRHCRHRVGVCGDFHASLLQSSHENEPTEGGRGPWPTDRCVNCYTNAEEELLYQ